MDLQGMGTLKKLFLGQRGAEEIKSTQRWTANCMFLWLLLRQLLFQKGIALLSFLKVYFKKLSKVFCILLQILNARCPPKVLLSAFLLFFTLNVYRHRALCFHKPPNLIATTHCHPSPPPLTMQEKGMLIVYKYRCHQFQAILGLVRKLHFRCKLQFCNCD